MTISIIAAQPNTTITCFHASDPDTTTHEPTIESGFDLRVGPTYVHLTTEEAYRLGAYLKNEGAEGSYTPAQILQDAADRIVERGGVPIDAPLGGDLVVEFDEADER